MSYTPPYRAPCSSCRKIRKLLDDPGEPALVVHPGHLRDLCETLDAQRETIRRLRAKVRARDEHQGKTDRRLRALRAAARAAP